MLPPLKLIPDRPHSVASTRPERPAPRVRSTYQVFSAIHYQMVYVRFISEDRGYLTPAEQHLVSGFSLPEGRAVLLVDYVPQRRAYMAVARDPLSLAVVSR